MCATRTNLAICGQTTQWINLHRTRIRPLSTSRTTYRPITRRIQPRCMCRGRTHCCPPTVPSPALDAPPSKAPRKRQAKSSEESKYGARDLLDIVQTAIKVQLFMAKHGEKGKKLVEFGNAVRALGIQGSDAVLKARLLEVLTFHEHKDPALAPPAIVKAIEGSTYEITLGAPLDQLAAQRRDYADKTDAEKDKMLQWPKTRKAERASLNRSRRTAATRRAEESDDDVEVVETPQLPPAPPAVVLESPNPLHAAAPTPLTPVVAPLRAL
ncbi:hypothetical protein K438DRAFT_2181270 [Mycena galopus ATCC 62051]|nr:hypothetical protein K438DRAFT_2181270 [Mycena galopus ATCC 62051]